MTGTMVFPTGFLWGAATSSLQIEGAIGEDGRGPSIWEAFAAMPGKIADGSTPEVACDHYHRWREDVELMKGLGLGAYRFSIAWPRIIPDGRGVVNPLGLDFYEGLVDALLEAGIQPFVTLYHWDLPQALQDNGGWGVRETAEAFAEYAGVVSRRLGDRVRHWITHNEPWCAATLGHEQGHQAPGHRDPAEALRVAHHLLLSHGLANSVLRENGSHAEVGIANVFSPVHPASGSDVDRDAARRLDGSLNRWYMDPIFRGDYPEDAVADRVRLGHLESKDLPFVRPGDLELISAPVDFLGVNYYCRWVVRGDDNGEPRTVRVAPDSERTDMGWEVYPEGLHELLVRLNRDYRPTKMYVTENGAAYSDGPDDSGRVADARRVEYLSGHLAAVHQAIADGVPLAGYFAWSLLDNFEWAHGYEKRFGLFWVDFATGKRIAKDSALWYRQTVVKNSVAPNHDDRTMEKPR